MKVTFPHLGNTCFALKAILDDLNIDYIMPPFTNKSILENGAIYSPEEICIPFKIMMGAYIDSIKKGADTIMIVGSCGPCRFGEYCELQMKILKKLGYDLNFIVLDNPKSIGYKEFIKRASKIFSQSPLSKKDKMNTLLRGYKVINTIDYIEKQCKLLVGYEKVNGSFKNLLNQCKKEALKSHGSKEMFKVLNYYKDLLKNIPIDKSKDPLKVSIVGEIYTIIEPFTNVYIEDKLMDYNVSSIRLLTPTWWIKNTIFSKFNSESRYINKLSKEYIPFQIGGYAKECVGETLAAYEKNFDGVIQIMPMGCMPEIVSKCILPQISKNKNFPIMTLVVDEMTGEGGYITRIEAFIDMLERRKNNVLYGS